MRTTILAAMTLIIAAAPARAQLAASAELKDPQGRTVGTATLTEGDGGVLIDATFTALPAGTHAFHIHETGRCTPDFGAAGGHFNPAGVGHGLMDTGDGYHAGDMPNIHVAADGRLHIEVWNDAVTLRDRRGPSLFDADGSALVVHAGADDYRSDPAGAAGDRIACGVIER